MKTRVNDCRKCRQQIADEIQTQYLKQGYKYFEDTSYSIAYLIIAAALSVHHRRGRSRTYIRAFFDEMCWVLKTPAVFGKEITMTGTMKMLEEKYGIDFQRVELHLESEKEFINGTLKELKRGKKK